MQAFENALPTRFPDTIQKKVVATTVSKKYSFPSQFAGNKQ